MNKLNTFTMHASKVIEVLFLICLCLTVLGIIASSVGIGILNREIRKNNVDVIGFIEEIKEKAVAASGDEGIDADEAEVAFGIAKAELRRENIIRSDNTLNPAIIAYIVYAAFGFATFFMIFRNINLILKTARGKTWFSEGKTPFQKDITRMIREIGIFLILLAVIELIFSFFTAVSVNLIYVVIGILMLCLSSFFGYGEQLQKENDGLI